MDTTPSNERLRFYLAQAPLTETSPAGHIAPWIPRSDPPRVVRWAVYSALTSLTIFLVLWLWIVEQSVVTQGGPAGLSMGVDFSHTYSAALAVRDGLDPYDYHVLSRIQHAVLVPLHLPVESTSPTVMTGTSPFFLWLLQPLTLLPYQTAAVLWMAPAYLLSGAALFAVLRFFGWKHRLLPTVLFMAAPQTVLATYYGNTIDLVFIGMACSLPLLNRKPLLAGLFLSLAVLKAPAAIPLALLLILFHASAKRRVLLGLVGSFVVRNAMATFLVGQAPVINRWTEGLFGFSQSMARQPNLIGFSGFYVGRLPEGERLVEEILLIGAASAITLVWYRRWQNEPSVPFLATAWLWPLWLLATPYAHFIDEMLLAIPLLAVLGRDAERLTRPLSVLTVALLIGPVLLYSASVDGSSLLWLPLLGVMLCFLLAASSAYDRSLVPLPRVATRYSTSPDNAHPVSDGSLGTWTAVG